MGEKKELKNAVQDRERHIELLEARLLVARRDAERAEELQRALENAVADFDRVNAELTAVYASERWKLTEPLARLKQRIRPAAQKETAVIASSERPLVLDESKKNLLFFDRAVPMEDRDAGSKATLRYINIVRELGFEIYFIPEDFSRPQPYTERLEAEGVHVLGEAYRDSWRDWLRENGAVVASVIISRPNVAKRFMEAVRQYTDARVAYMGVDLHYLRAERERAAGGAVSAEDIAYERALELCVMRDADATLMYSEVECDIIRREFGVEALAIPLYFYDDIKECAGDFSATKDMLFVGGFAHKPNADAVLWFTREVLPLVQKKLPDVRLHVVGSSPTEEILALRSDSVLVSGFVSDEELRGYYQKCRVCVVPLRFGAGVKGKTLEAMQNGIPVVSTAIGVEGMPDIESVIKPTDGAEEFAARVIKLYTDEAAWRECGAYRDYLLKNYSHKTAKKLMEIALYDKQ